MMRTLLAITVLLALASPDPGLAELPRPRYTTLTVEYVGQTFGYLAPVVITTSQEEGNWYWQHLFPNYWFVHVNVVPPSVLNRITELPSLERALKDAKPADDEPKTVQGVEFTAGTGREYAQIFVGDQGSRRILKGIDGIVAKYPALKRGLHGIEYPIFK